MDVPFDGLLNNLENAFEVFREHDEEVMDVIRQETITLVCHYVNLLDYFSLGIGTLRDYDLVFIKEN